jgi:hypothetical protein
VNTTPTSPRTRRSARDRADCGPSYKPEYADQARKLCLLLGAEDQDLARFFNAPLDTLREWLVAVPEFATAVHAGRTLADAEVADRLWRRAVGYSHQAVRIFSHQGNALEVPYTEHFPPDTSACLFWLKSRQPDKWRDKIEHEHHAVAEMLESLDAAGERARNARRG